MRSHLGVLIGTVFVIPIRCGVVGPGARRGRRCDDGDGCRPAGRPAVERVRSEVTSGTSAPLPVALVPETSYAALLAETLMAKAEVNRLAGSRHQAADSLHAALRIYEDRRAVPLANRARTALATVTAQPGTRPA